MALRSAQQEKERGGSIKEQIPPFFGVTPAPAYLNQQGQKASKGFGSFGGKPFGNAFGKF